MAIPGEIKKPALGAAFPIFERAIRGNIGPALTTMFWLPAVDPDADKRVVDSLGVKPLRSDRAAVETLTKFVQGEVSTLLPFLKSLKTVSLFNGTTLVVRTSLAGDRTASKGDQISVDVLAGSREPRASYFQLSHLEMIPPQVKNDPETPRAVRQMTHAGVRLSVRVRDAFPVFDPDARFHVYFPTDEPTGFGVTVHGDFYVKPDRTRLMPGRYNEWLMEVAGRLFAREFLTQLLARYRPREVFESLRPLQSSHDWANKFQTTVQGFIRRRPDAFVPTKAGLRLPRDVGLPACPDVEGFWNAHFAGVLKRVTKKEAFFEPSADSADCRSFLHLIGVDPLPLTMALDLIEGSSQGQSTTWWAEVYRYLATHDEFLRWSNQTLVGRRMLLTADDAVIQVPPEGGTVVCFAPTGEASKVEVPSRFRSVFELLNSNVVSEDDCHGDAVRGWLMRACRVARFDASDIVPRAIRGAAQSLYSDALPYDELLGVWRFVQRILTLSRGFGSQEFWTEVRRLPVPVSGTGFAIAPAFLTYWPDSHARAGRALEGVQGLRRLSESFLSDLMNGQEIAASTSGGPPGKRGLSGTPKVLTFVRLVGVSRETAFSAPLIVRRGTRFTRERCNMIKTSRCSKNSQARLCGTNLSDSPRFTLRRRGRCSR